MAEIDPLWNFLTILVSGIAVVTAAAIAVYGYYYNSKKQRELDEANHNAQRELEKAKTKYLEKLKAYGEVTEALSGHLFVLVCLQDTVTFEWKTETPEDLRRSLSHARHCLTVTREDEKAIGGSDIDTRIAEYRLLPPLDSEYPWEERSGSYKRWVDCAVFTLYEVAYRLEARQSIRFIRAVQMADILADTENLVSGLFAIHRTMIHDFASFATSMDSRKPVPDSKRKEMSDEIDKLDADLLRLRKGMRKDLQQTL